ncbi:CNNM domain-containing protein [Cyanobium gracile]|uniref:CBS domain-containing protein n=1 Tax=Cyanobium gracile (strain ATCC 27147 / PCC 6307) TaxID=292564 RepID=K9PBB4_CYAGP|nr:CNNM domain-containing protein [Cyanobium gracile]AFY30248.1 CBS domain-containing protein [Cyanobium gracile PCC 6307]
MNDLLLLVLAVVGMLMGSFLCSGVEAALLTVNPVKVHELASRPRPVAGARRLESLRQRLGRTLAVLVIANNIFNIFGSLMVGGFASVVFSRLGVSGPALPLFSVALTVLVILLGEILPKAIGSKLALPVALATAPALGVFTRLMLPLVLLLERILPAITAENEISTDEEEIRLLARLGSQKGQIEADEAAMIAKVFQLNDLTARDLMLPRVSAPTLAGHQSLDEQRSTLLRHTTAWWVVLGEEVDEVLGVASREQLLTALVEGRGASQAADLCEPVEFVPEMIRADRLLTSFRRNGSGVRVVVDEFGGFVGVIGPEAVLAVLAGWWRRPASAAESPP